VAKLANGTLVATGALTTEDRRRLAATATFGGTIATIKYRPVSMGGTLTSSGNIVVIPHYNLPLDGMLITGGNVVTTRILMPPPDAPEFAAPAEGSITQAVLIAKTPPPEPGALGDGGPPEFGLRG
jgi:hypothetical protein